MSRGTTCVKSVNTRFLSWLRNHGQSLNCDTCGVEFKEKRFSCYEAKWKCEG